MYLTVTLPGRAGAQRHTHQLLPRGDTGAPNSSWDPLPRWAVSFTSRALPRFVPTRRNETRPGHRCARLPHPLSSCFPGAAGWWSRAAPHTCPAVPLATQLPPLLAIETETRLDSTAVWLLLLGQVCSRTVEHLHPANTASIAAGPNHPQARLGGCMVNDRSHKASARRNRDGMKQIERGGTRRRRA
jgi:hypothetical protein